MALLVFISSSMIALAAVCPAAPDGVHHFDACKTAPAGRIDDLGYHSYLYGYDEKGNPIYKSDCKMTQGVQYCWDVCSYCRLQNPNGGQHEHKLAIEHSISHQ